MTNQTEQGAAAALLPCPFCGSTRIGVHRHMQRRAVGFRCMCLKCGMSQTGVAHSDQRAAAAAWNYRATASTPEGCTSDAWTDVAQGLPEPQMPVLLDIGLKYPIRAMWVAAKTLPVGSGDDDDFGEYVEDDDEWYCPEGWYEWNQYENRHWSVGAKPLRWMPLPTTTGSKP